MLESFQLFCIYIGSVKTYSFKVVILFKIMPRRSQEKYIFKVIKTTLIYGEDAFQLYTGIKPSLYGTIIGL